MILVGMGSGALAQITVVSFDAAYGMKLGLPWHSDTAVPATSVNSCIQFDGVNRRTLDTVTYSIFRRDSFKSATRAYIRLGVEVWAKTREETPLNPRLTTKAERLWLNNPAEFRATCGDAFLADIIAGGQYHADIEIPARPRDLARVEEDLVRANVYGVFADAAPFRKAIEGLVKRYRTTLREYPAPPSSNQPIQVDPGRMLRAATGLRQTVLSQPTQRSLAVFRDYDELEFFGWEP